MTLRSLADSPVAEAAVVGILCVTHAEVEVPSRTEEAHCLTCCEHLSVLSVVPDAGACVKDVAVVEVGLSLLCPLIDYSRDCELAAGYPSAVSVVGEYTVCFSEGSVHVVALVLSLLSNVIILCPRIESSLYLIRIICTENVLSYRSSVDKSGRAALEGYALDLAVAVGSSIYSVLILCGHLAYADTGYIECVIGICVLKNVVSFCKEHINLVSCGSSSVSLESLVELILVNTAVGRIDGPYDLLAVECLSSCIIAGHILFKEALELFVPSIDVEGVAFFCSRSGSSFGSSLGCIVVCGSSCRCFVVSSGSSCCSSGSCCCGLGISSTACYRQYTSSCEKRRRYSFLHSSFLQITSIRLLRILFEFFELG